MARCTNCRIPIKHGCLCVDCVRMLVVTIIVTEAIHVILGRVMEGLR